MPSIPMLDCCFKFHWRRDKVMFEQATHVTATQRAKRPFFSLFARFRVALLVYAVPPHFCTTSPHHPFYRPPGLPPAHLLHTRAISPKMRCTTLLPADLSAPIRNGREDARRRGRDEGDYAAQEVERRGWISRRIYVLSPSTRCNSLGVRYLVIAHG